MGSEVDTQTNLGSQAMPPRMTWVVWISVGASLLLVLWYFGVVTRFGPDFERRSALHWLYSAEGQADNSN